MTDILPWLATAATITAAFMTASNLGSRITGYGFGVFLIGSLAWLATGLLTGQQALSWTNAVLCLLNIFGIWRWLGRQAKVEEGAQAAVERSAAQPGETLFPISLLTKAKVEAGAASVHCVDAMAGRSSGAVHYLVLSEGGVGGVGETLRRADWGDVEVGDELRLTGTPLGKLPEIEREHWPAR